MLAAWFSHLVRDIAVTLENKQPLTSDNSTLKDFDMTLVDSVNPAAVSRSARIF